MVVLRNNKKTTFCVGDEHDHMEGNLGRKYQFIHSRSYAGKGSVIGGFDITAAACCYDGENIWMTGMCAFSLDNHLNVVDPTRRSTTYESRLRKYSTLGLNIVFPHTTLRGILRNIVPSDILRGYCFARTESSEYR